MNRSQRLLRLLRAVGQNGLCLSEVPSEDRYTARNAVATLRAQGYPIESSPCRQHGHGSSISRYRLVTAAATGGVATKPEVLRAEPDPVEMVIELPHRLEVSAPRPEPDSEELFAVPYRRRGHAI